MYDFCMDLFTRYPAFFAFFAAMAVFGMLAVLYIIALIFYKIISRVRAKRSPAVSQRDIDRRQDEAIETISKEAKKAIALEHELQAIKDRLGEPKEE